MRVLVVQITEAIIRTGKSSRCDSHPRSEGRFKSQGEKAYKKVLQHNISLTLGNSVENLKDASFEDKLNGSATPGSLPPGTVLGHASYC